MRELSGLLDEVALSVPVGEICLKEVAIKDLPLFVVITNQVFAVDLPKKEFLSEEEFEEYLNRYALEKFEDSAKREKFIRKQQNNALFQNDEIIGDYAWQWNGEVKDFKNARLCGFGILKAQPRQFFMFNTYLGVDLPSQFAAYQALTYGIVDKKYLAVLATKAAREHFKQMIGIEVYPLVLKALGIAELVNSVDNEGK